MKHTVLTVATDARPLKVCFWTDRLLSKIHFPSLTHSVSVLTAQSYALWSLISFVCRQELHYSIESQHSDSPRGWNGSPTGGRWNWSSSASINKWCLHGHIGLSNRAPSGQDMLHNSWTGYPRVRGRTFTTRSWMWTYVPGAILSGLVQYYYKSIASLWIWISLLFSRMTRETFLFFFFFTEINQEK